MEELPVYIYIVFALSLIFSVFLLYKASGYSKALIIMVLLWLTIQSVVSLSGYFAVTNVIPPRFLLLVLPPVVSMIVVLFTKRGRNFIEGFDAKTLTLLHVIRIPVELTLYWLFLNKSIPEIMTFEGRNFDMMSGLTAPLVYYFGYVKKVLARRVIIAWNIACLLLLANIVVTAILSAPFPFQVFAFDQPNIAILYFPFTLLPGCVVPIVLFAHVISLRLSIKANRQ